MKKPILRKAKLEDAPDLVEVYYGALKRYEIKPYPQPEDIQNMREEIMLPDSHTVVAVDSEDSRIVLAFMTYTINNHDIYLDGVYAISNECHAVPHLLGHVVAVGNAKNKSSIVLDSSPKAESYWEEKGFICGEQSKISEGKRYILPLYKADHLRHG